MRIKTGDKVEIIAGKDKGVQGTVLKTFPKKDRVLVEGANLVKKHQRPSQANPQGGIIEEEAAIHVSNVQLIDPETKEKTRVAIEERDGKRVRVAKKSGKALD
ncbi:MULTISPECIES: 50S ribosomal protein L24 [Aerococcus]|uniref:50S ribosomal protein L24 n=1 Tax=Aerococcus urinae (strain CCUG 59500 / ACS-120-V-Col10a) TaxID=2976812 RepID=UPI000200F549|nr:50S ribosomal protein L24 [Aerococcus sp. Group 1]AEA01590.1 ribosomal protein L24 [Aerococcus sp. Group 1]MCY3031197.1 50S ribosomal protein L24 [Aerococcus sp. Group 1]MCY3054935.1 50S ribosomal protein L24 [Aerococcus sp. Group 1]MCY3056665.1 50S ribosomal protein L24 [Aerococcus sp. Group 1]MCY3062162.1 50S ribosomal protein L24 [Aerococcus sp. Group 1]